MNKAIISLLTFSAIMLVAGCSVDKLAKKPVDKPLYSNEMQFDISKYAQDKGWCLTKAPDHVKGVTIYYVWEGDVCVAKYLY